MQGSKRFFLTSVPTRAVALGLAVAALVVAPAAARPSFSVTPPHPLPADRPIFTLLDSNPAGECPPKFDPQPTIEGNVLTFRGTRTLGLLADPPCPSVYRQNWQTGPLAAGIYTARVVVNDLQIAAVDFAVGADVPPLFVSPVHPNQGTRIHFTLSGVATSACPPVFSPPIVEGTTITIDGRSPLFPVVPSCQGPWTQEFSLPPLLPGTYLVKVRVDGELYASASFTVTVLSLPPAILEVDPRLPTTFDRITLTGIVPRNCPITFGLPTLTDDRIVLPATLGSPCGGPTVGHLGQATIGPLPAGAYIVELDLDGLSNEVAGITVTEPTAVLPLIDHRFAVTVEGPDTGGVALAVPLTDESGYFWFFDARNVELTVKILDGRAVNGHYWLFVASMTDVPFTVRIADLKSPLCGGAGAGGGGCPVKTYRVAGGVNRNLIDLGSL